MDKSVVNRHSGMELLRSISMALVVLTHADFWALGSPTASFCASDMARAAYQYYLEFFSLICVNCFIFISGWFSIKPTLKGFLNLIFQIYFYNLLIYLVCAIVGYVPLDFKHFVSHLNVFVHWFIPTYVALYLLAPIFNVFMEHVDKRLALTTVVSFVMLDVVLGWGEDYLHFWGGYSLLHFMVIYLIARYIRTHGGRAFSLDKKWDMVIFWTITLLVPTIVVLSFYWARPLWEYSSKLFWYNNPLIIVTTVYFCLFFSKLKFKSPIVNFIGVSSFAVYLIHSDVLVRGWCIEDYCKSIFFSHNLWFFTGAVCLLIVGLFVVAVVVDQLRKYLWNRFQSWVLG